MRLFFALWPTPEVRGRLRSVIAGVPSELLDGGRVVPVDKLHITLAFLGRQPSSGLPAIRRAAASAVAPRFVLELATVGTWPRSGVVWIGAADVPEALATLRRRLGDALAAEGFALDPRPFRPHVTIARHVRQRPPRIECEAVAWPVDRFCLVESRTLPAGAEYRIEAEWPLATE